MDLSESELSCIGDVLDPGRLAAVLENPVSGTPVEQDVLLACVNDELLMRGLTDSIIAGRSPLSPAASFCVREGMESLNPAGSGDVLSTDTGRSVALMIAVSCLTGEDIGASSPVWDILFEEREIITCFLDSAGGPMELFHALSGDGDGPALELGLLVLACNPLSF